MQSDSAGFVEPGHGRLSFQIKMLLTANPEAAFDAIRTAGNRPGGVAALNHQRTGVETALRQGVLDGQDGLQRPVFRRDALRPQTRPLPRVSASTQATGW